jgi:hypothetical protein
MIDKLKNIWNSYGFEIILGVCIIFILILSLVRYKYKGTWSKSFFYNPNKNHPRSSNKYKSIAGVTDVDNDYQKNKPKDSIGETECRRVLQKIFKKPFRKDRPDFLRNPVTGGNFNLEIDCFCREMKLGCEYHGQQHYKFTSYFHKNKEAFRNQQYRDYMKQTKCKENGISLIEVPYTVKVGDIEGFIKHKLKAIGYII